MKHIIHTVALCGVALLVKLVIDEEPSLAVSAAFLGCLIFLVSYRKDPTKTAGDLIQSHDIKSIQSALHEMNVALSEMKTVASKLSLAAGFKPIKKD